MASMTRSRSVKRMASSTELLGTPTKSRFCPSVRDRVPELFSPSRARGVPGSGRSTKGRPLASRRATTPPTSDEEDSEMDEIVFASVPMGKEFSRETEPVEVALCAEEPSKFEDEHIEDPAASLPTPFATPTKQRIVDVLARTPTASSSRASRLAPSTPVCSPLRAFPNLYAHANYLLSTSLVSDDGTPLLAGREAERASIRHFLSNRFRRVYREAPAPRPGNAQLAWNGAPSLYISGQPGLGKTALLMSEIGRFKSLAEEAGVEERVHVHQENCATLVGSEAEIWARLARGLGIKPASTAKDAKWAFELGLEKKGHEFLLILDEIDSLLASTGSNQSVLHALFVIAHTPGSTLTLIGIANSLDLAARELAPALGLSASPAKGKGKQSSSSLAQLGPQLLPFNPYDMEGLVKIVVQRLGQLSKKYPLARGELAEAGGANNLGEADAQKLFSTGALKILAKLIATKFGDARRMLGAVQYALAAAETRHRAKLADLSVVTFETCDKVTIADVKVAFARGEAKQQTVKVENRLTELPWPNRLALVGVVIALSRVPPARIAGQEEVALSVAFEAYRSAMSRQDSLKAPFSKAEFEGALSVLEGHAFVAIRSSSYSSSPPRKAGTRKAKQTLSGDPSISLSPSQESLSHLIQSLKTTPSPSADGVLSPLALKELLFLTTRMLVEEEKRAERLRPKELKKDVMAPREGFTGLGLEQGPERSKSKKASSGWMGAKKRGGREEEVQEREREERDRDQESDAE